MMSQEGGSPIGDRSSSPKNPWSRFSQVQGLESNTHTPGSETLQKRLGSQTGHQTSVRERGLNLHYKKDILLS
jgi:hypothetical protein